MNLTWKQVSIGLAASLVVGFLVGRFAMPAEKIEIEKERIVEVIDEKAIEEAVKLKEKELTEAFKKKEEEDTCVIEIVNKVVKPDGTVSENKIVKKEKKKKVEEEKAKHEKEKEVEIKVVVKEKIVYKDKIKERLVIQKAQPTFGLELAPIFDTDFNLTKYDFSAKYRVFSGVYVSGHVMLPENFYADWNRDKIELGLGIQIFLW